MTELARWRYLDVEEDAGIAVVRMLDPNDEHFVEKHHPMHREIRDVFPALADDRDVKAVVLAGGTSSFCPFPTLANLGALLTEHPDAPRTLQREARQIVDHIIDFEKPLVSAVAADARGMGAQVALLGDFIVASRGVVFQDTHTRLGLVSGDGATVIWPLIMGLARARRHVLRGLPLVAEDLFELGVVSELADDPASTLRLARELARKLAGQPRDAFTGTKLALNQWLRLGANLTVPMASTVEIASYWSPEFTALREGLKDDGRGD